MRTTAILCLALALALAASSQAGEEPPAHASHLTPHTSEVHLIRVEREARTPARFTLTVEVAMPEPMWKLTVDSVGKPDEMGRVVVKLSGERPDGNLPQVITMTRARIPLGALPVGDYLVDVFVRTPPHPHRRVGAIALRATR